MGSGGQNFLPRFITWWSGIRPLNSQCSSLIFASTQMNAEGWDLGSVGLVELFWEYGGRLQALELRKESGESDWKPLESVSGCSGAQCRQASMEGKG